MPIFNRCGDRLFVRYIRPYIEATAPPRRRAPPVGRGARGDEPGRRDVRRPAVPRVDDDAARRHAVREQLPRAARPRRRTPTTAPPGEIRHLKRLWLETDVLADGEKPERFRLGRTDSYWASKGRTKSELTI